MFCLFGDFLVCLLFLAYNCDHLVWTEKNCYSFLIYFVFLCTIGVGRGGGGQGGGGGGQAPPII